ncbi:glutathione synthetase [Pseudohyphozyma bogoriensis]|nr:glutathione synthetase [Pseudohyphozyma bogoriensis]
MATSLSWPPTLTPEQEAELLASASDYSLAHSLVYRPVAVAPSPPSTTTTIHAPYSLFPSPFPAHLFAQARELQPLYNQLYANITVDDSFLEEVVGGAVSKVDEFQGKLYELWLKVREEGIKQPLHLGLFRSDYLLHLPDGTPREEIAIKQVEFNTISSSFGALATKLGDMHRYLQESGAYPPIPELNLDAIPVNGALKGLAAGLAAGHKAYGVPAAKILMVVQDHERNAFDQRLLQFELLETHGIQLLRIPFSSLSTSATLSPSHQLLVTSPFSYTSTPTEISVVYYRSAYTPTDYPSHTEWSTRLLIERSTAIKCPTIALQLAGAKKVQQVLAEPGVLERFVEKKEDVEKLRESFTALYPLDANRAGDEAVKLAYSSPERFVLKPQREGGGNNIYREDIPGALDKLAELDKTKNPGDPLHREGYILMDLIVPPHNTKSIMVKAGEEKGVETDTVSELGVFGTALFSGTKGKAVLKVNETVGHLLRTKGRDSDEGGVAVGFSVIDSPLLV